MSMPLQQKIAVAKYITGKRLRGETKYPLVLELEPLLQCNLACAGCGKIQHPDEILRQRLSVEECIAAVEECGAPMVSIAGGEPLVHDQMPQIVEELRQAQEVRLLMHQRVAAQEEDPSFQTLGLFRVDDSSRRHAERHDQSVCREGVFDKAIDAIKDAKAAASVFTNTTFFDQDGPESVREVLDYLNDDLKVDMMQISPAYAYEKAPDQEHFLGVERTREVFSQVFADGKRKEVAPQSQPALPGFPRRQGRFRMHAVGNSVLHGVRLAASLLPDEQRRYAKTYKELLERDRLVAIRARQARIVRELHGALRLRTDGGDSHDGLDQGIDSRGNWKQLRWFRHRAGSSLLNRRLGLRWSARSTCAS
jgi:hopanoid biosynthesis associated radical SAM protein HpnH